MQYISTFRRNIKYTKIGIREISPLFNISPLLLSSISFFNRVEILRFKLAPVSLALSPGNQDSRFLRYHRYAETPILWRGR